MAKKSYDGWVMVSPRGKVYPDTFALTESACWYQAFALCFDAAFIDRYWKREAASRAAAKQAGWRMVKVNLVPVA